MRSGLEVSFSFLTPFNLVGCGAKSKMQWEGAMQGGAVQSATDVGEAALGKGTSNFLSRVPSPESGRAHDRRVVMLGKGSSNY